MPRPPTNNPTTTIHVRIDDSCLDATRRKLGNPITGNVPRGALSKLMQELLWEWVAKQHTKG